MGLLNRLGTDALSQGDTKLHQFVKWVCEGSHALRTRKLEPKLVKVANAAAWPLHAVKTQCVTHVN